MLEYVFAIAAIVLAIVQMYGHRSDAIKHIGAIILSIIYIMIVIFHFGIGIAEASFLLGVAILGTDLVYSYAAHKTYFGIGIVVVVLALAYAMTQNLAIQPFIEAFAVASFVALLLRFGYSQKVQRSDKKLEKRRDIVQILLGVIAIGAFVLIRQYAYVAVFLLVLLGYAVSSFAAHGKSRGFLKSIEREGSIFGAGAVYMAVGTMLILGSIPSYDFAILSLVALLICDAIATIIGVHGRHKLPYNKEKTIEGTVAYFIALSVIGFFFVSYYSIIFAVVLAILESAVQSVDDNIAVPVGSIIIYYLLPFAGSIL